MNRVANRRIIILYFPNLETWQGCFRELISDHEPYRYWLAGWQGRGMKSFPGKMKGTIEILDILSKA
jgi:hypothetical protein